MLDKIKNFFLGLFLALSLIAGALVFYLKRRLFVLETLEKNRQLDVELKASEEARKSNQDALSGEEEKRKLIESEEIADVSKTSLEDTAKFFNDRK